MIETMTSLAQPSTDLGKRKICVRFVPHLLTGDQIVARTRHSLDMKLVADADPKFLKNIVTADEMWCCQYESETKCQSSEWVGDSKPKNCVTKQNQINTYYFL